MTTASQPASDLRFTRRGLILRSPREGTGRASGTPKECHHAVEGTHAGLRNLIVVAPFASVDDPVWSFSMRQRLLPDFSPVDSSPFKIRKTAGTGTE
jgi:hypothetical protein